MAGNVPRTTDLQFNALTTTSLRPHKKEIWYGKSKIILQMPQLDQTLQVNL